MAVGKDIVCGMSVKEDRALKLEHRGRTYYFCSDFCRQRFSEDPERYVREIQPCAPEKESSIAYFSMEIAIDSGIPTYSGGLGILAGDMLRSCADLKLPVVAVTLLYEKGYFFQELDAHGNQLELPAQWNPRDHLKPLTKKIKVQFEGRRVYVKAWEYDIVGITGCPVPVFFLDTNLRENSVYDRTLTRHLYGGDE